MIELNCISKTYYLGEIPVPALSNINLSIGPSDFLSIIGPSGSGKSTLMNILGCLDYPDNGTYYFDGMDVLSMSETKLAEFRSKKIGFIFQQFNLIKNLSAYENVELPLIYQGIKHAVRKKAVTEILTRLGLDDRMNHLPLQLSGGQQQRVAIARALITNPRVIIADEPTGNLDSKASKDVMGILSDLNNNGKAVILITHDEQVAQYANKWIRIRDGMIIDS